jgi:hypothetical protein
MHHSILLAGLESGALFRLGNIVRDSSFRHALPRNFFEQMAN